MSRAFALEGIKNFRDFGGYQGQGGRRIKTGLLYRGGHQGAASDADLAALAALGIGVIVDLRHSGERAGAPSRRWPGFAATLIENDHHAPTPAEQDFDAAFGAYLAQPDVTAEGVARWQYEFYADALTMPRHVDLFSRYFRALGSGEGAMLIHCSRGKDRTGMLAALTHHIAGVSRADLLADYLRDNGMAQTPTDTGHAQGASPEIFRVLVDLRADYLDTAFSAVEARYGSLDGYLARALGVDAKLRAAIEARILE